MSSDWELVFGQLSNLKNYSINESKRVLKTKVPKNRAVREEVVGNLIRCFNDFIRIVNKIYTTLNDNEQKLILKLFTTLRDRVVRSFQVLQLNYRIPSTFCEYIDPQIKDELIEIDSTDSGTDLDTTNTIMATAVTAIEFFNLASKILPHEYDGSPDKLQSFLDGLSLLRANATGHEENAVAYIKTRLCGKARDLISDNDTLQDIGHKLKQGIKTESSQAVTSKILGHKQFQKDKAKYAEYIETLSVKLKRAYISEGVPEAVAETYCANTVVKALSTNSSSDKAKLIMEAGTFNSTQEAITKFVGITSDNNAID
ncbi:unnamed protein product [Callosobruchus maculatus]|uniref:Uncharacterized protein n=1 Tax=Callosobruchus maculatus TaxID=64391 RepID=A0A653CEY6_CALMS|nr:unnamed protein product [Callosobruchus maculatus]